MGPERRHSWSLTRASSRAATLATVLLLSPGVALFGVVPAASAKPTDPKAIEIGKKGNQLYADGDFEGAKEAYEKAFAIEADPVFLYGVAQALNQMGDCKAAILKYKQVKENPAVSPEIKRFSEEAMVACAEKVATEGDEPSDDPPASEDDPIADEPFEEDTTDDAGGAEPIADDEPKPRKWYKDPLGDSLVAIGAAGTGAGIGLLVAAELKNSRKPPGETYAEFDEREKKVRTLRIAGGVTLGIGGALLIAGIVRWAVLGTREKNGRTAQVGVVFDDATAGLSLSGRF